MPSIDDIDIAVVDVSATWLADRPSDGWQFITGDDVGNFTASDTFLIVGYPKELMTRVADGISGPPVMIITSMIAGIPPGVENAKTGLDRFFHYARESKKLGGGTVSSIELPGVSGAAVWQYTPLADAGLWSPARCLQMLAVEHAYKLCEYVRGHDWRAVMMIVGKVAAGETEVRTPDELAS